MTIKRQRVNAGAFDKVEADPTDSVDTLGFSDEIQSIGAKTAKFSGGGIMKANNGLKIGLTQVKINTSGIAPPLITEITPPNQTTYFVGTDGWSNQFRDTNTVASITLTQFNTQSVREYDTSNIFAKNLIVVMTEDSQDEIFNVQSGTQDQGSNDCSLTHLKIFSNFSRVWDVDEADDAAFTIGLTNILTDATTASLQAPGVPTTKRYIRFTEKITTNFSTSSVGEGSDNNCTPGNCNTVGGCCVFGCSGLTQTNRNAPNNVFTSITDSLISTQTTVRLRSSATQDTADGTVLISDQVMNASETLTFITPLLLTGLGQFVTVEIVDGTAVPVTLSDITSIQEV